MLEPDLTLEDLSEHTGVETRTLRSWVSEGLLAPPLKAGRGARYPASNADRALAVRALKDLHGLSLAEIGRRFMMASQEQIRDWALEAGTTSAPPGSARDYLVRLRASSAAAEPPERSLEAPRKSISASKWDSPRSESRPEARFSKGPMLSSRPLRSEDREAELASIERLILQLEKVLEAPAPRRARGALWTRISVTPDLELSVRGALEPRERILFEQLADQFRAILMGGTRHD